MITVGNCFAISQQRIPRFIPKARASYETAVAIPRSYPVTTGFPFSSGCTACVTEAKKASPSRHRTTSGHEMIIVHFEEPPSELEDSFGCRSQINHILSTKLEYRNSKQYPIGKKSKFKLFLI